jgi:hypothetical protein
VPREHEPTVRKAVEDWALLWKTIVEISHRNREALGRSMRRREESQKKGSPRRKQS